MPLSTPADAVDTTGVSAGTTVVLFGPLQSTGAAYLYALITSTQAFTAYIEISPDLGATWTQAKSVVGAAGPDATYTLSCEISQYAPSFYRVTVKNTSGSSANFRADIRHFEIFAH